MKHRLMVRMGDQLFGRPRLVCVSILICMEFAGTAMAASLHSLTPSGSASIVADAALTSNPSTDEARVTFFHVAQNCVKLEIPIQSVVAEPVVLPDPAEGKPDSAFPSSAVLFALVSFGMIGMVSRSETVTRKSHRADSTPPSGSGLARVIGLLSPDPVFAKHIETQLRRANYDVRTAGSASGIVAVTDPTAFMLMVVDHRVCDWDMLRTDPLLRSAPVMGVVPRGCLYTEDHCLSDLERGMDGVHDFRDGEGLFLARVHAYVRRVDRDAGCRGVYQVGAVQLDTDAHEVTILGRAVKLSAKPFAILAALMREPSKIFSRSELVNRVWGKDFAVGGHALDVHIHALRQQLNRESGHRCRLVTIKGVGFKLKPLSAAPAMLETGVSQARLPMAAESGALLTSGAGRLEGLCLPFTESSGRAEKIWRKPTLRRRARSLRKTLAPSHRHAAALAG